MKNILSGIVTSFIVTVFLLTCINTIGQVPNAIPYQGVARNANGEVLAGLPISLRISIHDGTAVGTVVFKETHAITTTALGLFSVNIGGGTPVTSTLANVNWATGAKFIQVEMDAAGGSNYADMGTTQLNSVPYALYARSSGSVPVPEGVVAGQVMYWDGTAWTLVPAGQPGQYFQLSQTGLPIWSGPSFSSISTTAISSANYYISATSGGNIAADGGSPVTTRGVCWATSANPTIANSKTSDGTGTGGFTSTITPLIPSTTYYVRAYATNGAGTAYGNQQSFTSVASTLATVSTTAASSVTGGTALSGVTVSSEGGSMVTAYGVCWGIAANPTIADSKTTDGTGAGTVSSIINKLVPNTTYYVRAYATNFVGTAYGNQISFTTNTTLAIGGVYQGGVIAYILQPGDPGYVSGQTHGFIAAPSDQSTYADWGNYQGSDANGTALGTGLANSNAIFFDDFFGDAAASICRTLSLSGYNDWFLPSKDELNKLYLSKALIGGFTTFTYWSSSKSASGAWAQSFYSGTQSNFGNSGNHVRAIRAF